MKGCVAIFLFYFLCTDISAQTGALSGMVRDGEENRGLSSANVFLSNATNGTQTNSQGHFLLRKIKPGQYDLVVSHVGYDTWVKRITINQDTQRFEIKLHPNNIKLREVVIGHDPNWARNYANFKRIFIGSGENSGKCIVSNPKILSLFFDSRLKRLEASSDEFLIIENEYLGYRLKYLLKEFEWLQQSGLTYYAGQVLFENLNGTARQLKRWKENRRQAYFGSNLHFFRLLRSGNLHENGYLVRSLQRIKVADRPSDAYILEKIRTFHRNASNPNDSLAYWRKLYRSPKAISLIGREKLESGDIAKPTNLPNLHALDYQTDLHLIYEPKKVYNPYSRIREHPTTIIAFQKRPVLFDLNGVVANPRSVIYEGAWNQGIVELLPQDYEPE
ncbi:carboxypeptidase-like regulatory domain-containing protein [Paradesertivirga mongoliensis]|uniref:Carboxypeptidase-like regulatory domain-containing protein n=1 Tax=Paradesertivirga mongoliensis TaxID=2100740 RepID=A0ABW4ZMS5_9SPHI